MKFVSLALLMILLCSSCARQQTSIPVSGWDAVPKEASGPSTAKIWTGETPLMHNSEEPVCALIYQPIQGLKNHWYPSRVFSDTNSLKQIIDSLTYPEEEGRYAVNSENYLLLIGIDRSLHSHCLTLIPFLTEQDKYILLPTGRDKKLYEIIHSAPLKENYYQHNNSAVPSTESFMPQNASGSTQPLNF